MKLMISAGIMAKFKLLIQTFCFAGMTVSYTLNVMVCMYLHTIMLREDLEKACIHT